MNKYIDFWTDSGDGPAWAITYQGGYAVRDYNRLTPSTVKRLIRLWEKAPHNSAGERRKVVKGSRQL